MFLIVLGGMVLIVGAAWSRVSARLQARNGASLGAEDASSEELQAELASLRSTVADLAGQLRSLRSELYAEDVREHEPTPLRRVA